MDTATQELTPIQELNPLFWFFAIILVGWCVMQTLIYLRMALRLNQKHKCFTKDELQYAAKVGVISSIGPALSNLFLGISLVALVDTGITFMRCGVMGTPSFELSSSQQTAGLIGIQLGVDVLTHSQITFVVFGMAFAVVGYMISPLFTLPALDFATKTDGKATGSKKNTYLMKSLEGLTIGCIAYVGVGYWKNWPAFICYWISFGGAIILSTIIKKTGYKKLSAWSMVICMVIAMTVAQLLTMTMA